MMFVALILFNIKKDSYACESIQIFLAQDISLDKHLLQEGVKILKLMKQES